MAIVDVNQLLDEELGPAPKKPAALDVNQLMDEELGMRMAMPQERPTKPQVSRPAPTSMPSEDSTPAPSQEAYRGIGQALKDTAISSMDLAVAMLPGAGSMEAGGAGIENPVSAALNLEEARPIPSMAEDIEEGRNLDATFKGLGVAGDVATAGGLTMMATGAGMIPGAFLTAGGVGMKAVSKYGDDIADGLRKLFDMDKDAAMKAAERIDSFADDDKPIGAAISMLGAETKKVRKAKNMGSNSQPPVKSRESAPARDLGLFNRAEEAVLNMDIPEKGIRGDALLSKLSNNSDVPKDEIEFGLGLAIRPDDVLTKDDLRKLFSTSSERGYLAEFGLEERVRMQDPTQIQQTNSVKAGGDLEYEGMTDYRYPDEPGSNYSEYTYHLRPSAAQAETVGGDRGDKLQEYLDRSRTANRGIDFSRVNPDDPFAATSRNILAKWDDTESLREIYVNHYARDGSFVGMDGRPLSEVIEYIDALDEVDVRADMYGILLGNLNEGLKTEVIKVRNRTRNATPPGLNRLNIAVSNYRRKFTADPSEYDDVVLGDMGDLFDDIASDADGVIDPDMVARLQTYMTDGTFLMDADVDTVGRSGVMFRSPKHFYRDNDNQLFHMRTSIRTTNDGKRVLLIEEIQSDALSGAKKGTTDAEVPYKNEGYMNLALARAMRIAAEQGLDGISLTNAAAQIERNRGGFANVFDEMTSTFGKSETGEDVTTVFLSQEGNVKTRLTVDPKTGEVTGASQQDLVGMQLSEVIDSRETAQQLLDKEGSIPVSQRVIGEDGYKTVYDKKLPSKMRKIVNRMDLNDSVDVTRSNITVGGREVYPDFVGLDDEFDPDLFEEMMEALEEDANNPRYMLTTLVARMGMRMYGQNMEEFTRLLEKKYGFDEFGIENADGSISYIDPDVLDLTYEDVFDVGRMATNDRDRKFYAMTIQRSFPDKYPDITDAEDFVDLALEQNYSVGSGSFNTGRVFEDWAFQKQNMAGEPITVKDNHTVIFTDEMRKKIMEQGLPRLRKGGLATPK